MIEYTATRLTFKRDEIERLNDDDYIKIHVIQDNATYKMTKREFYQTFYNVVSSRSYKEIGSYICMVLASDIYDEGDYIRNYNNFKKIKKS